MAESSLTRWRGWTPEERGVRYRCQNSSDSDPGDPTGFPIIEIFFNMTKSYTATNAMVSALIISVFLSVLGLVSSGSRLSWVFARDDGLQFPRYFSHNSATIMILDLINSGSTTAFNALVSLALLGQYMTYMLPTISILGRRLFLAKNIPIRSVGVGQMGCSNQRIYYCVSCITIGFNVLPPYFPVTATNMNYAGVVFGAALIICGILWFWMGQKHYAGPIKEVMENGNVRSALLSREAESELTSGTNGTKQGAV
ncbi:hypothetical protein K449DRAFT_468637 [Hypoxylon sp. EC38]|nr:hypothetical protein K449DRAFT_468637 [Hypoxylon sp. EC38]